MNGIAAVLNVTKPSVERSETNPYILDRVAFNPTQKLDSVGSRLLVTSWMHTLFDAEQSPTAMPCIRPLLLFMNMRTYEASMTLAVST